MYSNNNYHSNLYGNINDDSIDVGIFEPQEDINIFPEGIYEFSVKNIEKTLSSASTGSKASIWVFLEIKHPETKNKCTIKDFFVLEHKWKIGKFLDSIGKSEIYRKSGKFLPKEIINSKGYADFFREPDAKNPEKFYFKPKTFMTKEMIEKNKKTQLKSQTEHDDTFNDEIPF